MHGYNTNQYENQEIGALQMCLCALLYSSGLLTYNNDNDNKNNNNNKRCDNDDNNNKKNYTY